MIKQRHKLVVQVEGTGSVIQCVDDYTHRSNFRCVSPTPVQGVHQEQFPKPYAAGGTANGQSAQERGRDERITRESLADSAREIVEPNTVCGKGVVAENGTAGVNQDERRGDPPLRVLASLMLKVLIEFCNARAKRTAIVGGAQWFYLIIRFSRHASPLGNLLAVLPSGTSQDRTWTSRIQDGVRERLGLTYRQNQHGAIFDRPLRSGFGAVEDEIGHGASLQIGRSLDK
jgi:hypothetical protein